MTDIKNKFFSNLDKIFNEIREKYQNIRCDTVNVGISGGADSFCLVILLREYAIKHGIKIKAYTVDHNLREESSFEAEYVHKILTKEYGIEHEILIWHHENSNLKTGHIERAARKARYDMLIDCALKNSVNLIFVAHNQDDLIETYILRRLKKSHIDGLASISAIRELFNDIFIVRPMLNISKKEIKNFLIEKNISWFEDQSNYDDRFLRAKIRKFIAKRESHENPYDSWKFRAAILKRIAFATKIRVQKENIFKNFLNLHVRIDYNFGYAKLKIATLVMLQDLKYYFLQRLIWFLGGAEYPPAYDTIFSILSCKKTANVGKMVIKFQKDDIIIFREQKNLPSVLVKNYVNYDNRFFIQTSLQKIFVEPINDFWLKYLFDNNYIRNFKNSFLLKGYFVILDSNKNFISCPAINAIDEEWKNKNFASLIKVKFSRKLVDFFCL